MKAEPTSAGRAHSSENQRRVPVGVGFAAALRSYARVAVALVALSLGGCSLFGKKEDAGVPCPKVSLLADTNKLVRFRPGEGRDITDIELRAEITGYRGSCIYSPKRQVLTLTMQVSMNLERGPAAKTREAALQYFIAIPAYYPKPDAKRILDVATTFPPNSDRIKITDNEVDITFNNVAAEADVSRYGVLLGLQLDPGQLDYNRAHRAPGS